MLISNGGILGTMGLVKIIINFNLVESGNIKGERGEIRRGWKQHSC